MRTCLFFKPLQRFIYLAGLMVLTAIPLFSQTNDDRSFIRRIRFGLEFNGGYRFLEPEDLNKAESYYKKVDQMNDNDADTRNIDGAFTGHFTFTSSYRIAPRHQIGFQVGYQASTKPTFKQYWSQGLFLRETELEINIRSVPIDLYYRWNMNPRQSIHLLAGAGVNFIRADLKSSFSYDEPYFYYFQRGTFKDQSVGGHAFLAVEKFITPKVAVKLGVDYFFARLNDLKGAFIDQDGNQTEMRLIMIQHPDDEWLAYPAGEQLTYLPADTPLSAYRFESRYARLDFSGFRLFLGIQYVINLKS